MSFPSAPFFSDIPNEPSGQAFWVNASDSVRLRVGVWDQAIQTGQAKGTVLLFPGRTEYIEKYALTAHELTEAGFVTCSIDWRGQGLSDRLVDNIMAGHVDQFSDYQKDVAAMMEVVQTLDLPKPFFLLGHSMGGCIGLRSLVEDLPVNAAAFTGPMWNIGLPTHLRLAAHVIGAMAVTIGLGHLLAPGTKNDTYVLDVNFEDNQLTKNREMYERLQTQAKAHPETTIGGPSLRWLTQALYECRDLAAQPTPNVPCLTALGTDEKIVCPPAIHSRMDSWSNGKLMMVPAGEHEVLMEGPDVRGPVTNAMIDLFNANL